MGQPNRIVDSSRFGVIILTAFALVWLIAAATLSTVPMAVTIASAGLGVAVAIMVNVAAASREFLAVDEEELPLAPRQRRTVFIVSNVVQAVLFSALISVCIALNELAYIPLVGSIIVGGHLIPIGRSFREATFVIGGSLLILTGIVGTGTALWSFTASTFATGIVSLTNAALLIALAGMQVRIYGKHPQTAS